MNRRNIGIIVAVGILIVLIAEGMMLLARNNKANNSAINDGTTSNQPRSASTNAPSAQDTSPTIGGESQQAVTTITYSTEGFSPLTLTVNKGTAITIKNSSSSPLQFNSDPHPSHTNNPELNVGTIDAGQSKTFTVSTTGTWGYHNHLNPSQTGSIIVK